MKKLFKNIGWFLKKLGAFIVGIIVFGFLSPWVAMTCFGAICGSLFHSFMTGFPRGASAATRIALGFAFLRADAESKNIDRKSLALIHGYPGGLDKLLADYNNTPAKLRADFVFKHFGADHVVQIEMYLKVKLEEIK